MQLRCFVVCGLAALAAASPGMALEPAEVLILVNRASAASSRAANLYREMRKIPPANVLRLELRTDHVSTREEYRKLIAPAVRKRLEADPNLRCLVTTPDFPYTIQGTPGKEDGAAVDNELAAVLRDEPADLNRWQPNPLYIRAENPYGATDPRAFRMVYVARLEGPDMRVITRMVEDAIATEQGGLYGPVFGDTQGSDGHANSAGADASIRGAIDRLAGAGYPATLDMQPETWKPPAGGVGEQAAGAAFYVGWYSLQTFQDVFGRQGLARGAIAWHIASGEAVSPWSSASREWCPNLLRRGAAVTIGPAFEPYLGAFPKAELFVEQLLLGKTVAESYWLSLPHVSWAMVLLGDPLYRPFAQAKASLVARGYVAETPDRVLRAGQSAAVLARLECVGPAGSSTPALSTAVEAEMGLAEASGKVTIPALRAGESVVVRLPRVTAGKDPTAMFRLRLKVDTPGEVSRRIVVEGRTGFALVSGGAGRQSRMFASPKGSFVIAGLPGAVSLIETASLTNRGIRIPAGWGLAAAAFSPDERHFVLTLLQPEQKQALSILADSSLRSAKNLPAGTLFLRWQTNEKILMRAQGGLLEYSVGSAAAAPVTRSTGWEPNSVIAGTDIAVVRNADGGWGIRKGSETPRRVLDGASTVRDTAVADDLSLFGGIDAENRLWMQRGFGGRPQPVAEHVGRVAWGPISRRAAVETADGETRVYDGRDGSWSKLGRVLAMGWSADERRLVYITGGGQGTAAVPESLMLWDDGKIQELCSMIRIGDVAALALSGQGEAVFLLAGNDGGFEVWMMGLGPATARVASVPKAALHERH